MTNVELMCEKSFSKADGEIVDFFIEFQQALIDGDADKLNEIILDDFEIVQISGKSQSKNEFISEIADGSLDYSKCDILEPTILQDDDNAASLIAKVRLTAEVHGRELRWISNTVASFEKADGKWYLGKLDC